ncbi:cytochrome P450 [Penicillium taxi]|uniref:cytochrome P450 n=1 Tax=Penicillium taxi TaxID=168475 RepID=UPI00254568F1|nr:cytochrome P450 [Penicillium taxi]KAJ5895258.1 cytochrome P450 [Penicillium taxi]
MSVAFSDQVGFMEKECDVNSLIDSLVTLFSKAQLVATLPLLAKLMRQPWYNFCFGSKPVKSAPLTGPAAFQAIAKNAVHRRVGGDISAGPGDLLQRFLMYKDKEGQGIPIDELELEAFSPAVAGPDSTAMALRAGVLYIATHQRVHRKMMAEIDEADRAGKLSHPVAYTEIKKLPYFNAIVKEIFRVFPPIGTAFPRVVPPEGVTILGHFLPGGTEIGMNFWAISRDKSVYGEDADYFRPERWLESPEKAKLFDRYDLNFGAGHCICVGKNIALVEVHKVLLEIFRNFDVDVLDPTNPWKLKNILTFVAHDFNIKLSQRGVPSAVEGP